MFVEGEQKPFDDEGSGIPAPDERGFQDIETPIARLLVKGELRDGDTATVDSKDGQTTVIPTVEAGA